MFRIVSMPGPPPASCRTCRERHKKCDMVRPHCNRCMKGGYDCQGYEVVQPRVKMRPNHRDIPVPEDRGASEALDSFSDSLSNHRTRSTDTLTDHTAGPSILAAAVSHKAHSATPATTDSPIRCSLEEFDRLWPQDQSQPIACPSARCQFTGTRRSSPVYRVMNAECNRSDGLEDAWQSIPPSVDVTRTFRECHIASAATWYFSRILGFRFSGFSPTVHDTLASQAKGNRTSRVIYVGAVILQALSMSPQKQDVALERCTGCIRDLERRFATDLGGNCALSDTEDWLIAYLELASLKCILVDSASTYALLRATLPRFLSLVATEPHLLVEQPHGSLAVSFPFVLGSHRVDLSKFVICDVIWPFLFGVIPLIGYAYEGTCSQDGFEWLHGIPGVLFQVISQVNSHRAGSCVHLDDWHTLERRVLTWQSFYVFPDAPSVPDRDTVERATVQEGWRHVVLIYIYMGICGVSSHDSRVQASVDRIFQLAETMGSSRIGIHMLPHCVVAGVAARLEKQRVAIYERLMSFGDVRPWFLYGPQFCRFLRHLWHGVGAGGGAVRWDDYVRSRHAIVPI